MTTLYVGNLPFSATEAEIRSLFEQHGKVDAVKIVNDRDTGRPRGFGFVDMPGDEAPNAIQHLNGYEMNGRPIRVNEARERAPRPPRSGGDRW
jgi:RNA recognition motif-containing protein